MQSSIFTIQYYTKRRSTNEIINYWLTGQFIIPIKYNFNELNIRIIELDERFSSSNSTTPSDMNNINTTTNSNSNISTNNQPSRALKTKRNQSDAISNKFPKTSDSEQLITSANSSTNKTSIDSKLPPNIVENVTPGNEIEIEEVIENDDHNNPNIPSRSSSINNNTYNNNEEKILRTLKSILLNA